MTTKTQMVTLLKAENPTLQIGNDDVGYTQLSKTDYDAKISEWADNRLAVEAAELEAAELEARKIAVLTKLGITADELRIATT